MYLSWLCVTLIMRVTAEGKRVVDYHLDVGIPLAKWIKKTEDKIHAKPFSGRRVVGGGVAPPKLYPYLGGLLIELVNRTDLSICASTLITTNHLLTAAHCWKSGLSRAKQLTVVLASEFLFTGGTRIKTSQVLTHPKFHRDTLINDIAIIILATAVPFSDSIKPAILPYSHVNDTFDGEWVFAAGYGSTRTDSPVSVNSVMSHVKLQVIPISQCKPYYSNNAVLPTNICTDGTGGVGICDGDSGGPLVSIQHEQAILIGITSFAIEGDCEEGYPSVYTRVASFLPFIMKNAYII